MYDVICVGDAAVDDFYRVPRLPEPDEKVYARYLGKILGGTTCNTARALHVLGDAVLFVTQLGDDTAGFFIRQKLDEIGIHHQILTLPGSSSFSTVVIASEGGEKIILLLTKEGEREEPSLYEKAKVEDTRVVYSTRGGAILNYLVNYNAPIVLSLEVPTIERYPDIVSWATRHADTLILDRHAFLKVFRYEATPANLAAHTHQGLRNLVVTLGARGAIAVTYSTNQLIECGAYPIQAMDTTAAGDIFSAAFVHSYYVQHLTIREAMQFSNAVAAASCEEIGTELSEQALQKARLIFQIEKGGENRPD